MFLEVSCDKYYSLIYRRSTWREYLGGGKNLSEKNKAVTIRGDSLITDIAWQENKVHKGAGGIRQGLGCLL